MSENAVPRVKPLYRGTQIVWYILSLVELLLGFRFALKFIAANPAAGFSTFIYMITAPLANPFLNVVQPTLVVGSVFEWTTLLAMLVYWLLAWCIVRLLVMGKPVTTKEADTKLAEQDKI